MSILTNNDITVVEFQDDVDSFPHRTNNSNIKNAVNDNQAQISAIVAPIAGNSIKNGTFDSDTIWVKGTGWTIAAGVASCDGSQAGDTNLSQDGTLVVGQTYEITFEVTSITAGVITPVLGTTLGTSRSTTGTFTETITVAGTGDFDLRGDVSFIGSVDNVTANGAEIENARDGADALRENIRFRSGFGDVVSAKDSFQVEEVSVPDDTVQVKIGTGILNGIGVKTSSILTSGSITESAAGNHKRVVVVINSDNTISALEGSEVVLATTPPYPSISQTTQMPLANFIIDETIPVVINNANIVDDRLKLVDPFKDLEHQSQTITFNGSNQVDIISFTDRRGFVYNFIHTYTTGLLTEVTITIFGMTITNTLTYNGMDQLTNQDITFVVV